MKKKGTKFIFRLCIRNQSPYTYEIFEVLNLNVGNLIEVRQLVMYNFYKSIKDTIPHRSTRHVPRNGKYKFGDFEYEQQIYNSMEELMEQHILDLI